MRIPLLFFIIIIEKRNKKELESKHRKYQSVRDRIDSNKQKFHI
ncbi:YrzI family protein [Salimicrobium halophilum]|uniref:Sporulation protein (Bac_small_yrzI) n=1 Tax=Salimicrobium halophilum TaxID=86666 RepID=A0A1G8RMF9_9BACI|nr:YrzI family protein [Salimicrobium halophilum]SDJ18188.1 hypothetical protein SAMN04490247_1128 [Salimicrobium halophilum]